MNNDTCLICLDTIDIKDMILPHNCNCKVKLHLSCLELIKQYNMLCPICRIKSINKITLNSSNNYVYVRLIISNLIIITVIVIFLYSYLLRYVYYIYLFYCIIEYLFQMY